MPKRLICSECGKTGGNIWYIRFGEEFRLHEECYREMMIRDGAAYLFEE